MVAARLVLGGMIAAAGVSAVLVPENPLDMAAHLLKRQAPGSPEYNCHDNCGQALRQGRFSGAARCESNIFLTNYANCLQCAGPDNVNIWVNYGATLTTYGSSCGLSTTPLSGVQPAVGAAIPAVDPATVVSTTPTATTATTTPPTTTGGSNSSGATTSPSTTVSGSGSGSVSSSATTTTTTSASRSSTTGTGTGTGTGANASSSPVNNAAGFAGNLASGIFAAVVFAGGLAM